MQTRIHFLDNLRTFAIFMVVVVHSGIVYESILEYTWIVSDPIKNNNIALIRMYLDLFIMFSLFFISGYFTRISAQSKSSKKFIISKFKRIMIPWFIAVFTLIPVYKAIFLASRNLPQEPWYSYFHFYFREGGHAGYFADNPVQNWLWFLPILFLFQMIYLIIDRSGLFKKINLKLSTAIWSIFILGVAFGMTISLLKLNGWHHSFFLHFQRERILIYFMFYLLGSLCSKKEIFQSGRLAPKWYIFSNIGLTIGLLVFTVVALNLFFNMIDPERNFYFISSFFDRLVYHISMMISIFSFLHVLIYTFQKYLNGTGKLAGILNANSYDVYIIHVVVIGLLAWLILPWLIPAFLKFGILIISSFVISNLLVYLKRLLPPLW